jgi:hypothetical protein
MSPALDDPRPASASYIEDTSIDGYDLTFWDPGNDYSIPPRPMDPHFDDVIRSNAQTGPCHPVYKRLEFHERRVKALLRAWGKVYDINIVRDFYNTGKSCLDLIHFANDLAILRSNCLYLSEDINETFAAIPPSPRSVNDQAFIRSQDLWNRLNKATIGFSKLIDELDTKIMHEKAKWHQTSDPERKEFVVFGMPLVHEGNQTFVNSGEEVNGKGAGEADAAAKRKRKRKRIDRVKDVVIRQESPQYIDGVLRFHPEPSNTTNVNLPTLPSGSEGRWDHDILCTQVKGLQPMFIDISDSD